MTIYETKPVHYIYLDVVHFTVKRSVEAQTDVIRSLNEIVVSAVQNIKLDLETVTYIPTGDGMCIALISYFLDYDAHIQLSENILELIYLYNSEQPDKMRQFEIRIGVGFNVDNIVTDINGFRNVAGAGINMAQRVMDLADGSQILVSQGVFETLSTREKYMDAFRVYNARVKHDHPLTVYQYTNEQCTGLSTEVPSHFAVAAPELLTEKILTEYQANYLCSAIQQSELVRSQYPLQGQSQYALCVLLHFLTLDAMECAHSEEYEEPTRRRYGDNEETPRESYEYYRSVDFWLCAELTSVVERAFDGNLDLFSTPYLVLSEKGTTKLASEHPHLVSRFELEL